MQSNTNGPNGDNAINDLLLLLSVSGLNASAKSVACGSATGLVGTATNPVRFHPLVITLPKMSTWAMFTGLVVFENESVCLESGVETGQQTCASCL